VFITDLHLQAYSYSSSGAS